MSPTNTNQLTSSKVYSGIQGHGNLATTTVGSHALLTANAAEQSFDVAHGQYTNCWCTVSTNWAGVNSRLPVDQFEVTLETDWSAELMVHSVLNSRRQARMQEQQ